MSGETKPDVSSHASDHQQRRGFGLTSDQKSRTPPRSAACCTAESSKQVRLLAESPKAPLLLLQADHRI
jgi:hypothetical protein